jgi:hypothetical protein
MRSRELVIYSDMRQATTDLNLETSKGSHLNATIDKVEQLKLVADLHDVRVYILGAQSSNQRISGWRNLRGLWQIYFNKAGATVVAYSALRDPPQWD